MKHLRKGQKCEWEDCKEEATVLVYWKRNDKLLRLCDYHAAIVVDDRRPEYTVDCPNCGCRFGVN